MIEKTIDLYCANHPQTPTRLRCNRCEKPICPKCAVQTPTGYRCKECVRGQQKIFDTAQWYDYPLAFLTIAILTYLGSLIVNRVGFFTIFLAPVAGLVIGEASRWIVRRRRSKKLTSVAIGAVIVGCLPMILTVFWSMLIIFSEIGLSGAGYLFTLLWQGVYLFMVSSAVYYRLSGIKIR
jgi:hypothetical protein